MQKDHENWLLQLREAANTDAFSQKILSFVRCDVPLKTLTTFKVGGNADIVIEPPTIDDLIFVLKSLHTSGIRPVILGRGSNVVASDDGFRGILLHLSDAMNQLCFVETSDMTTADAEAAEGAFYVKAEAGASLAALSMFAQKNSLTGLEFASGIPGSVGGGLYMNAGAYGGELGKVLVEATVSTIDGEIKTIPAGDLAMSYRHTRFMEEDWIILSGVFRLHKGDKDTILEEMHRLNQQRKEKQPLEYPSAGSFFKRPTGYFAGKLIQDANLKGVSVGGAMVSPKHAGFLINTGDATAKDIIDLMHLIQKAVRDQYGVTLEAEVKYLSEDGFTSFQ